MNNHIKMYSITEASEMMGIGKTKIYQEIGLGKLRARKFGSRTLVPVQAIEAWINSLPVLSKEKE